MAIKITYTGEGPGSWPPPPSQLFSALVAAWGYHGQQAHHRTALEWLECQAAPTITAGPAISRRRDSWVPMAWDSDSRNIRSFASTSLRSSDLYYHYPSGPHDEALKELCNRIAYLGNSHCLVTAGLETDPPEPNMMPNCKLGQVLDVPHPGRLQHCIDQYERKIRLKKGRQRERLPRPLAARPVMYGPPELESQSELGDTYRFRLVGRSFPIGYSAPMAEKIHRALVSIADSDVPALLHGHTGEGILISPVAHDRHLISFDLTFPPASMTDRIREIVSTWMDHGLGEIAVECTGQPRQPRAKTWITKTPIIWPRHPRPSRMEAMLQRMTQDAGLVMPSNVQLDSRSIKDTRLPRHYKRGWFVGHAKFAWEEPLTGPISLGAARNFGMGSLTKADD